jgi:hypothetical protein
MLILETMLITLSAHEVLVSAMAPCAQHLDGALDDYMTQKVFTLRVIRS